MLRCDVEHMHIQISKTSDVCDSCLVDIGIIINKLYLSQSMPFFAAFLGAWLHEFMIA